MRVYISGPMTGLPYSNFPAFNETARSLRACGLDVVNPAEINPDGAKSWSACMRADIAALVTCDAIALMPGWENSNGAHLELHIAHRLAMHVTTPQRLLAEYASKLVRKDVLDDGEPLAFPTIFGDLAA